MRIGELAALVGVSTRTVRHYHEVGVLAEPARSANGYRVYTVRDAVLLSKAKRLADLGMKLHRVRDVMAGEANKSLRELMTEIDADLAAQALDISRRRARLAELCQRDDLDFYNLVSEETATVVDLLRPAGGIRTKEIEWLTMMDSTLPEDWNRMILELTADPDYIEWMTGFYDSMDALAAADVREPGVGEVVDRLAIGLAEQLSRLLPNASPIDVDAFSEFLSELPPCQAEVVRRALRLID